MFHFLVTSFFWAMTGKLILTAWEAYRSQHKWVTSLGQPLQLLDTTVPWCLRGFKGGLNYIPMMSRMYKQRNHIKSNRNQIVLTIFRFIWNRKRTVSAWYQTNRIIVNTICCGFGLTRFGEGFCVCWRYLAGQRSPRDPLMPGFGAYGGRSARIQIDGAIAN